jgi:hypothetical protein
MYRKITIYKLVNKNFLNAIGLKFVSIKIFKLHGRLKNVVNKIFTERDKGKSKK